MKTTIVLTIIILALAATSFAQPKNNADISKQIKALRADSNITLNYDVGSNASKLMAVSENFSNSEASSAGIQAMNFATGFFYLGPQLDRAPDPILLTFWVLSKKPMFGNGHGLVVYAGDEKLDLGDSRYVARARDNMEYLNFNILRAELAKIASQPNVRFTLGSANFTFTKDQLRMLANLLTLSDPTK